MEKDGEDGLERHKEQAGFGIPHGLEMDPADYLLDMDEFDLTEAQKVELLETLWDICRRFIEMDIDIGDANPCGQIFGTADEFPAGAPDGVKSLFTKATETRTDKKEDNPA